MRSKTYLAWAFASSMHCQLLPIFKAQRRWVGMLLPLKESWPFRLRCSHRCQGQIFLKRFCVLCFIFYFLGFRIRKMHKDHIIIKYYSLFSFGDLLAIYFFINFIRIFHQQNQWLLQIIRSNSVVHLFLVFRKIR